MKIRYHLAVIFSKLTYFLLRLLGRNASHTPGAVAMAICPKYLEIAPKAPVAICVTGTNGKTTVANMLTDALLSLGRSAVSNRLGSNIVPGVAACVSNSLNIWGKCKVDCTVFEVDERASRLILPFIKPDYLIVTNIFRDSLKRNAHPDYIFGIINDYTPNTTKLILNADDLCSAMLRPENKRVYNAIEEMKGDIIDSVNIVTDHSICPKCHSPLSYEYRRYHHIGRAHCPSCGFASPRADYSAAVYPNEGIMCVTNMGESSDYPLVSDIVFNMYNEVAVIAALSQIGFGSEQIASAMEKASIPDTRLKETVINGSSVIMAMSKGQSCISSCRTFDYVSSLPGDKMILLVLDDYYDRKNSVEFIGWIYDVDYEFLNKPDVVRVAALGPRCLDHRVRLLLAGIDDERIFCEKDELLGARELPLKGAQKIFVLYDTSTYDLAVKVAGVIENRLQNA